MLEAEESREVGAVEPIIPTQEHNNHSDDVLSPTQLSSRLHTVVDPGL